MINTDSKSIENLISRHINEAIPGKDQLAKKLTSGKKLTIYQGFDPTSPYLHIGHLVGILTLRKFQQLGHQVIFLIGDFTATIGDPSGKDKTRVPLTRQQVLDNCQSYQDQIKNILDFEGENKAIVRYNSEWLSKMNMEEVIQFAMGFTAQQMLERDMFQNRLKSGKPIALHEFLYPVLVTKDALAMDVDIELGGSDQLFNMSIGRHLIRSISGKDKYAITTKLLTDANGKKIGKSEGNAINISSSPEDLFGQVMSLQDEAIYNCFQLATTVSDDRLPELKDLVAKDPMQAKKTLALKIIKMLHSEDIAKHAQAHFENTVQKGQTPDEILEISIDGNVSACDIAVNNNLVPSNSQFRRLVDQNAVKIDGEKITDPNIELKSGQTMQIGKRRFIKRK